MELIEKDKRIIGAKKFLKSAQKKNKLVFHRTVTGWPNMKNKTSINSLPVLKSFVVNKDITIPADLKNIMVSSDSINTVINLPGVGPVSISNKNIEEKGEKALQNFLRKISLL